jgi:hypothetical protein
MSPGNVDPRYALMLQQLGPKVEAAMQNEVDFRKFLGSSEGSLFLEKDPRAIQVLTSEMGVDWLMNEDKGLKWLNSETGQGKFSDIMNSIKNNTAQYGSNAPKKAKELQDAFIAYSQYQATQSAFTQQASSQALTQMQATTGLMQKPNINNPQPAFMNMLKNYR